MKKILLFVFAATIFAACEKETAVDETPINTNEDLVTYTFSVTQEALEGTDTKATISDAGVFAWEDGDQIAIYNTVDSKYYLFSTTGSGSTADFSRDAAAGANFTVAYYPALVVMSSAEIAAGVSASAKGTTSITLPDSYTASEAASGFPMTGSVNAVGELSMAHLGGMLRFTFTNVPTQATKLVVSAGTGISGAFTVADGKITAAGTGTTTVTFSKGDYYGTTAVFSVPVPTGTYSSITVSLQDTNSKELFGKTKSTSTTVARKKLWKVASVNAKGEEFYLIHKGNGWSLTGNAARFIKTGANTYAVAGYGYHKKNNSEWGFKVQPGYYHGVNNWDYVYGRSGGSAGDYNGSLGLGGTSNNCGGNWDDETDRLQEYTINMSTLTYSTTDIHDYWTSGASKMYFMSEDTGFSWSSDLEMTKVTDQNWKLSSVTVTSGSKEFKLFEVDNSWGNHWYNASLTLTNGTPYGTLSWTGSDTSGDGAHYNLTAGSYDIYFNSAKGYIWFVPAGE